MKQQLVSKSFDLPGNEIGRVSKLYLINRFVPLGNLGGMTRFRELLILTVLHRFGALPFRLLIRYEDPLTRLYKKLKG